MDAAEAGVSKEEWEKITPRVAEAIEEEPR